MIKTILRWFVYAVVTLLLVVVLAGAFFLWRADLRETEDRVSAAPPSGRFVHASDVDVFIQEKGPPDGIPVLFVHAAGGWSGVWDMTGERLSKIGYRTIAVDMPPLGYSQRPAAVKYSREDQAKRLIGVLDALGIRRAALVGHSFGGRAVAQTALAYPDRVRAVAFVDAALSLEPGAPNAALDAIMSVTLIRRAVTAATVVNPSFTKMLLDTFVADSKSATPYWVAMYQKPLNLKGTTHAVGDWLPELLTVRDTSLSSGKESYKKLRVPALVLWGEADTVTPLQEGKLIASLIPGSRLVVLPRVGHMPPIEDIDAFNTELLKFLESQR